MNWWIWCAAGLVLTVLELATPGGFFIIFFGLGALLTGALTAAADPPAVAQWIVFPIVSVVSLLGFRKPLMVRFHATTKPSSEIDSLAGQIAVAAADIAPGATGQVELRGTNWSARNGGARAVRAGQRCRVTRLDGLTLTIEEERETP